MRAGLGLQVVVWVPVAVKEDHHIGGGEVNADPANAGVHARRKGQRAGEGEVPGPSGCASHPHPSPPARVERRKTESVDAGSLKLAIAALRLDAGVEPCKC